MEGRITFYTYGSSIELNGKLFAAGELTTDLLNLSAERYQPMHQQLEQVRKLAVDYIRTQERAVWWDLNERLSDLSHALREYKLFQLILGDDDVLFCETRSYTERYSLFPEKDLDWDNYTPDHLAEMSRQYAGDETVEMLPFMWRQVKTAQGQNKSIWRCIKPRMKKIFQKVLTSERQCRYVEQK